MELRQAVGNPFDGLKSRRENLFYKNSSGYLSCRACKQEAGDVNNVFLRDQNKFKRCQSIFQKLLNQNTEIDENNTII